jgi:hypothetical protein
VRDTIARRSDVDASSLKYDIEPGSGKYRIGTITFQAKKGRSIDLEDIHQSLKVTRLGGNTRSGVKYFDITAKGTVAEVGNKMILKVAGTQQQFALKDDPKAKPKAGEKTPFERLRAALAKGDKVASVTGRVEGWNGRWPEVLRELPGEPVKTAEGAPAGPARVPGLVVTGFETSKE